MHRSTINFLHVLSFITDKFLKFGLKICISGIAEDSGLLERYVLPAREAPIRCNIPQDFNLYACELFISILTL